MSRIEPGDRVIWDRGLKYGRYRGEGVVQLVEDDMYLPWAQVRWDDPGLDDEQVPIPELSKIDTKETESA